LTLKSALQRCAFYFVYRGAAAVPTAALSIYCAAGVHFPALRCAQVTATTLSDQPQRYRLAPTGIECSHWVCAVV
jgi:hypothetical protein